MALTRTLVQLRDEARQLANMENSEFASDAEVNRYVNSAIRDLYDKLVQARGEQYYRVTENLTTTADQSTVALSGLSSDFYKLLGIDLQLSGRWLEMRAMDFHHRNNFQLSTTGRPIAYLIKGADLEFFPTPGAVYTIRVHYLPLPTTLSLDADTFDGINGWEDWVVKTVGMWLLLKEESDISGLMAERARIEERIEAMAQSRDHGEPRRPRDVRNVGRGRRSESEDWWRSR